MSCRININLSIRKIVLKQVLVYKNFRNIKCPGTALRKTATLDARKSYLIQIVYLSMNDEIVKDVCEMVIPVYNLPNINADSKGKKCRNTPKRQLSPHNLIVHSDPDCRLHKPRITCHPEAQKDSKLEPKKKKARRDTSAAHRLTGCATRARRQ